ncbi:hypothetical protein [Cerasicoccus fimbriatus]|uniref:hypothetical protein n=1 Tax=Cerasicoccus fimbriatus TaxID=3014554 RepID=UPI0022B39AD7|nr:hypothetical protein [Cerasicoccus sp. TK19100]
MSSGSKLPGFVRWPLRFLAIFFSIVLFLAVTGAVVFIIVGALTNPDKAILDRMLHGFRLGAELAAKVWAPAISFVLCVMWAHREHEKRKEAQPGNEV